MSNSRSVNPGIRSTARSRRWLAGCTGEKFVLDSLSIHRTCAGVCDMIVILTVVAEGVIGTDVS